MELSSILALLESSLKPVWHIPLLSVQWINSWWWTQELPETCRVSCQNKFVKLVHLVGFIIKKFVTMHGHMNVNVHDSVFIVLQICSSASTAWKCGLEAVLFRIRSIGTDAICRRNLYMRVGVTTYVQCCSCQCKLRYQLLLLLGKKCAGGRGAELEKQEFQFRVVFLFVCTCTSWAYGCVCCDMWTGWRFRNATTKAPRYTGHWEHEILLISSQSV